MLQKNRTLTQAQADLALASSATPLPGGCRTVRTGNGDETAQYCWETDGDRLEATGAGILNVPAALAATPGSPPG
jgi:hypothetical protein